MCYCRECEILALNIDSGCIVKAGTGNTRKCLSIENLVRELVSMFLIVRAIWFLLARAFK